MADDTQEQPPGDEHAAPIEAFHRALAGVQLERAQLDVAIREHDWEDVEIAAGDAAMSWLAASAACKQIAARGRAGRLLAVPAKLTLHAAQAALLDLFERARRQSDSPRLHGALERYRSAIAPDESP